MHHGQLVFNIDKSLFDSTEQWLHIWDVSQVLQQLMQQVIVVRRDGLQMFQKQLNGRRCD